MKFYVIGIDGQDLFYNGRCPVDTKSSKDIGLFTVFNTRKTIKFHDRNSAQRLILMVLGAHNKEIVEVEKKYKRNLTSGRKEIFFTFSTL